MLHYKINKQQVRGVKVSKRKKLLHEEEQLQKSYLISFLADLIRLYYKYNKNEKFDTFEQYLNGYKSFYLAESKEEQIEIYKEVDNVIMSRYELFFAHYELTEPIHCVDVSEERLEE